MRYKVDRRTGIVAVVDTKHPDYKPGECLSGADYIVRKWMGTYTDKGYIIETFKVKQANVYCKILEALW